MADTTTGAQSSDTILKNTEPIDPTLPENVSWLEKLQGNILSGHGRDHTVNLFLKLPDDPATARELVAALSKVVTSAHKQEVERREYKTWGIPGGMFGNLFLSANGYRKLDIDVDNTAGFPEPDEEPRRLQSSFLAGMARHAEADFGDPPPRQWDKGFARGDIDLMLLLADDDADFVGRAARQLIDQFAGQFEVLRIERGTALRTDEGEGIEHFGYVDGRSQPLYLTTDFQTDISGTKRDSDGGKIDIWDPFEPLERVLVDDPTQDPNSGCFGSFFVFRKLEQNVRDFVMHEKRLADDLDLVGKDRDRAGAMAVGRFRDGTPLVLSPTDGFSPPKENNFRYTPNDEKGLKCPFQAHIRKTNPRRTRPDGTEPDRTRRITRRGIPYGPARPIPISGQEVADLPAKDVGLLFMCFQKSVRKQFGFMQRTWANNQDFSEDGTGIDPVIGRLDKDRPREGDPDVNLTDVERVDQSWQSKYGNDDLPPRKSFFGNFVTMKGGEFFFAPSIPFFQSL